LQIDQLTSVNFSWFYILGMLFGAFFFVVHAVKIEVASQTCLFCRNSIYRTVYDTNVFSDNALH
jgi:hypothetical protein